MIVLVPIALILLQPDMGEALAFFPIFLLMGFVAGAQVRHLMFILCAAVLAFVLAAIPTLHARDGPSGASFFGLLSDPDIMKYLLLAAAVVVGPRHSRVEILPPEVLLLDRVDGAPWS